MKLSDFVCTMEEIAPRALAWERDNPGLLVGTRKTEIRKVFLALDCTLATAREAVEWGADMMLTHHPLFFDPIRRILPNDPQSAGAFTLIENGVGLFAAHTNLDAAKGGVNDALAALFGIREAEALPPDMLGRVGELPSPMPLSAFAALTERLLGTTALCCGDADARVARVAFVGGSGGSALEYVCASGADTFLTGEIKHNQALWAAEKHLNVIAAGHYETERIVLAPLLARLQAAHNDVQYRVTQSESACLRRLVDGTQV